MDFPDTDFFFIKIVQKILDNLKLILTVLEFSFKVIELKSIDLLFFLFDFLFFLFGLFCFWSFFGLDFLLFLFCLLGLLLFNLSFDFWLLLDFELDFEGLFSTKDNLAKIFAEDRNGSNIIIPSKQIDKLLSLALSDNQFEQVLKITN